LLSDVDVRAVCQISDLVLTLDDALRKESKGSGAIMSQRVNLGRGDSFLRVMPAFLPETGVLGLKFFHGTMAKGVRYVVALCSLDSGAMLALLDGAYLTAARTGATTGVATKWLAREDAGSVGVIGSGLEAETNLLGISAVREITKVRVFSRSAERRHAFAERMSAALGVPVVVRSTPEQAVRGADVVLVATNTGANGPVAYRGAWMEPGQHVTSIGSTAPGLREIDVESFLRPDFVAFDAEREQIASESGDVIAVRADHPAWNGAVSLDELVTRALPGRSAPEDITLFKSVGTAGQDLIGALHVYQEAVKRGIGTDVGEIAKPKLF
jgi:ornithine cyclodeaminase/alanine dehydrogenase-like protein (mu-crystallin family)